MDIHAKNTAAIVHVHAQAKATWSPVELPGLLGYWAADLSVMDGSSDGDAIGTLRSIYPANVTLTESTNKPVLKRQAGPAGTNVLRFTQASSTKLLDSTVIGQALSGSGTPFTITTVAKVTSSGTNVAWGLGHGTGAQKGAFTCRRELGTPAYNCYHTNDANSSTTVSESKLLTDAFWHVDSIVFDGTNLYVYVDGALQDIARAWGSGATTMNRFCLGAAVVTGLVQFPASMDWCCTIVNKQALSGDDVKRLHSYLGRTYLRISTGNWISRDEFLTPESNPLASPRVQEPGPGRWTVVDTTGKLSIANGRLAVASGSGYDPAIYTHLRIGSPGLMIKAGIYLPGPNVTTGIWCGLTTGVVTVAGATSQCVTNYVRGTANGVTVYDGRVICPSTDTWTDKKYFEMGVIALAGSGAACLVRRPGMSKWQLNWVDNAASLATVYPRIADAGKVCEVDNVQVMIDGVTVPSPVGSSASLTAGQTVAGHVDGLVYATFAAATGVTKEVYVRYTDANNCIIIRCDQTNSLLKVVEKVAGVENQILSTSQTWTNGTSYTLGIVLDWQSITVTVNNSGSSSTTCLSTQFLGTLPSTATLVAGSHTLTNVAAWPKYVDAGDGTCAVRRSIYAVGDSITRGEMDVDSNGDFLPYPLDQCGWPQRVCAIIGGEEVPKRSANGGWTVAMRLANIATDLNGIMGSPSDVVCMYGTNEMTSMPTEAQFKSDYLALIAAWHRKYPDAKVWLMKPWRRGKASEVVTIAAWIDAIVADPSCSAFTKVGADCSTFLPGTDDGASTTVDGIHPNRAGHILLAAAQAALMA